MSNLFVCRTGMLHSSFVISSIWLSKLVYFSILRSRSLCWLINYWILFRDVFFTLFRLLLMSCPSTVIFFATLGGWHRLQLGTRLVGLVGWDCCWVLFSRLGSLTSYIAVISVLRRVRRWWMIGVFKITLGDFASVYVDTVGVVVGASLTSCVLSMIAVK